MSFEFRDLTVRIGKTVIVEGASSMVERGKITALIGPNGSGKSTLLTGISGIKPSSGRILCADEEMSLAERRSKITYMPQDIGAQSSLTALEVVLLGRLNSLGLTIPGDLIDDAVAALTRFDLAHLQGRNLSQVSGGQRQLIYLTQALFRSPELLLLDEPTASLDLRHQLMVLEAVRSFVIEQDIAVIIAIHDMSLAAQFADHIICMNKGHVDFAGPTKEALQRDRIKNIFGVEVDIMESRSGNLLVVPERPV